MDDYNSFNINNGSCTGFSPEHFNNKFSSSARKLFLLNFNIRSFNTNFDDFAVFLEDLFRLPDLIILTETWNSDEKSAEISGFKSFHCNRPPDKRGGGVSIFINNELDAKSMIISKESLPDLEYLHVKLILNNASNPVSFDILGIYHPPNPNLLSSFLDNIDSVLNSLNNNTKKILAGDFNICGLSNNPTSNQLFNVMRSYSLMPHISRITRPNYHGQSTGIDHIWSNFGFNFESGIFDDIIISDHRIAFVMLPLQFEKTKLKSRFRNHSEQCIKTLFDGLTNFNLFFPLLSANLDYDKKFDLFFNELERLYKKSCPIKVKELGIKNVKKPWISSEIIRMIKYKHILFRRSKIGEIPYADFKNYQTNLNKTIKTAKQNYFRHKYQNCHGQRTFFTGTKA